MKCKGKDCQVGGGIEVFDRQPQYCGSCIVTHVAKLEQQLVAATKKWQDYEENYILLLFKRAAAVGFDLQQLVFDNPGKNSSELFASHMEHLLADEKRHNAKLIEATDEMGELEAKLIAVEQRNEAGAKQMDELLAWRNRAEHTIAELTAEVNVLRMTELPVGWRAAPDADWQKLTTDNARLREALTRFDQLVEAAQTSHADDGYTDADVQVGKFQDELPALLALAATDQPKSHSTHGRYTSDSVPNATYCPCVGVASTKVQLECAVDGCEYCRAVIDATELEEKLLAEVKATDGEAVRALGIDPSKEQGK